MDTSLYFIRCKGEERGPYAFYQIQEMRTEDVLTRDHFTPEEWEQFEQFLDDGGDVPRPRNGVAAIRKAGTGSANPERGVAVALTYLSYAMGGFVVLAALLQGEQDYVLQSRPMFWFGLFFAVTLCHTAVDLICRRQINRYPKTSRLDLLVKYCVVLMFCAAGIGLLLIVEKIFKAAGFSAQQILSTGKIYLIAAGIVSFYKPFYLAFLAEHGYLKPRRKSSAMWLATLLGWVVMFILFLRTTPSLNYPAITDIRERLFTVEKADERAQDSNWKFLVHLGDTQKAVQRLLGKPEIVGNDFNYHCLRVSFNQQHKVSRLRFGGDELRKSIFAKKQLLGDLTPISNLDKLREAFGAKNVTFGDQSSETHVWELSDYRVAACFWTEHNPADRANTTKWLEISASQ